MGKLINNYRNIAVGYFDGVHIGHQRVLHEAIRYSEENGGIPTAVTFDMSESRSSEKDPSDILPLCERVRLLKEYGICDVVILPFDDIKNMSGKDFVSIIIKKDCKGINVFTGEDFRFGVNRGCGVEEMSAFCKECGLESHTVSDVVVDGKRVSSSLLRHALSCGEMSMVNRLIGREYGFSLPVYHDKHLARQLGFPTINQHFPDNIVIPREGVYCSQINLDGNIFRGVSNLGTRPTVGGDCVTLETHILNFSGDLYDKEVKVDLLFFIRDEHIFENIEELSNAIKSDIEFVRNM